MKEILVSCILLTLMLTLGVVSSVHAQEDWGLWTYLSNGVAVRFKIVHRNYEGVGNHLWTWQFKNEQLSRITSLEFTYTEYKRFGTSEVTTDYFPGSLEGGGAFGGWAAFTAVSSLQPTIRIVEIERR